MENFYWVPTPGSLLSPIIFTHMEIEQQKWTFQLEDISNPEGGEINYISRLSSLKFPKDDPSDKKTSVF